MASVPFTEKYRPRSLKDVVSQEPITRMLEDCLASNNLPHMLFYGPPGTGKTSTIIALSKQYYGEDVYKNMILELNGSDDRGINVIRTQIKNFAKLKNVTCPDKPKIIILDEADSLTNDAQFALRRVIERFTSNVRFCLLCNYLNKVIPAIQSRCLIMRFSNVAYKSMLSRVREIKKNEGLVFGNQILALICDNTCGDFRRVLNFLQQRRFTKEAVIQYFYGMGIEQFEGCVKLLDGVSSMKDRVCLLDDIRFSSNCTFAEVLKVFTYLGIQHEEYRFLGRLADLEYKFFTSNYMLESVYFHALAAILAPEILRKKVMDA